MIKRHITQINRFKVWAIMYSCYIASSLVFGRTRFVDLFGNFFILLMNHVFQIIYLLLAVYIMCKYKKYTIEKLCIDLFILAIFFISSIYSGSKLLFYSMLLIYCSTGINFEKQAKFSRFVIGVILIATVFFGLTGMVNNEIKVRVGLFAGVRNSFGFNHPNTLAMVVFQWLSAYLFTEKAKYKYLVSIIITYLVLIITYSYTATILSFFIIFYNLIIENLKSFQKMSSRFIRFIFALIILLLILIARYYWKNPFEISSFFRTGSARITISQRYLDAYKINLFGHEIIQGANVELPGYSSQYNYLDNGYVRILIQSGLLSFIIYFTLYLLSFVKLIHERDLILIGYGTIILIYGFFEYPIFLLTHNIFLIKLLDFDMLFRGKNYGIYKKEIPMK